MIDRVEGVERVSFAVHGDKRGSLVAIESGTDVKFDIRRVYYIYGTQRGVARGKHAHRNMNQVLICVNGSCDITLFDGKNETTVTLESPQTGVYISGYVWREMSNFSEGCVLLVLADKKYAETEYIYDRSRLRGE